MWVSDRHGRQPRDCSNGVEASGSPWPGGGASGRERGTGWSRQEARTHAERPRMQFHTWRVGRGLGVHMAVRAQFAPGLCSSLRCAGHAWRSDDMTICGPAGIRPFSSTRVLRPEQLGRPLPNAPRSAASPAAQHGRNGRLRSLSQERHRIHRAPIQWAFSVGAQTFEPYIRRGAAIGER